jgi:tetratricopeptide (TPR) repeat protein
LAASDFASFLAAAEARVRVLERFDPGATVPSVLDTVAAVAANLAGRERCVADMLLALHSLYGDTEWGLLCARGALSVALDLDDPLLQLRARHRLFVALMSRGMGATSEALELVTTLLRHCAQAGDLRLRYTTLANRAVWLMEVGEYDAAERHLLDAAGLLEGATATGERLNLYGNRAEIALATGLFDRALMLYKRAAALMDEGTRAHVRDIIQSGLGLAALETGDLTLARASLDRLHTWPLYFFDPLMLLTFRARMSCHSGATSLGLDQLHGEVAALEDRFPALWIRGQIVSARLHKRYGRRPDRASLVRAMARATDLGLSKRSAEIQCLVVRP